MTPRRRAIVFSGLAITIASQWRRGFAQGSHKQRGLTQTKKSLNEFLELSSYLTGFPVAALNADVGALILKSFQDRGMLTKPDTFSNPTTLATSTRANAALTQQIIAAWYSGVCQTTTGPTVITYDQALVWHSAAFLHPPSSCGGAFGYWSVPPADI